MMLVERVLIVLVAALTWQTMDNGGAIHTSPFLIITQHNAFLPLAFSVCAPISHLFIASLTSISGSGDGFLMLGAVLGFSDSWQTTANAAFMMLMVHAVSW